MRDILKRQLGLDARLVFLYQKCSNKVLYSRAWYAASPFLKLRGLIGRSPEQLSQKVLILPNCWSVHTFCMKHPIDVAFFNKNRRCISTYTSVEPGHVLSNRRASFVLERFSPTDCAYTLWFVRGQQIGIEGEVALGRQEAALKRQDLTLQVREMYCTPSKRGAQDEI